MSKLLVGLVVAVENLDKAEIAKRKAHERLLRAVAAFGAALKSRGVDIQNAENLEAVADEFEAELKAEAAELTAAAAMLADAMADLQNAKARFDAAVEAVSRDAKQAALAMTLSGAVDSVNPSPLPSRPPRF